MKASYRDIDISSLREILRYDNETGNLYWLERKGQASLYWRSWNSRWAGREAFRPDPSRGYKSGTIWGHAVLAHRVVWALAYGYWPDIIDHINGDPGDNRLENLRNVTTAINNRNMPVCRRNKSGFPGVRFVADRNKWRAGYAQRNLGSFGCITAAIIARRIEEIKQGHTIRQIGNRKREVAARFERVHAILARGPK